MTDFYEKARNLWQAVQNAQILKGLAKYPEPFNPHSWTPEELLNHALEESVDLTHYLVGLKDLLDTKDDYIKKLESELVFYRKMYSKPITPQKSPFEEQESVTYAPSDSKHHAYFDADDQ